eukprot:6208102-Pleurochrysis_carterae.AAC.1
MASRLVSLIERLGKLLEAASGSGSSEAQPALLELLHQIQHELQVGDSDEIKQVQKKLEELLTAALLAEPAPPTSKFICSAFCTVYARGSRTTMYTMMELLSSWISNKASPATSNASRVAILQLLGELCAVHGTSMINLALDAIALLIKQTRAAEPPLRVAAWSALAASLTSAGGLPVASQQEMLKSIKQTLTERNAPLELRVSCLSSITPLAKDTEGFWQGRRLHLIRFRFRHQTD